MYYSEIKGDKKKEKKRNVSIYYSFLIYQLNYFEVLFCYELLDFEQILNIREIDNLAHISVVWVQVQRDELKVGKLYGSK